MKPCPVCSSTRPKKRDGGYHTFNPQWYICRCEFTVDILHTTSGTVQAKSWDEGVTYVETVMALTVEQRAILRLTEVASRIVELRARWAAKHDKEVDNGGRVEGIHPDSETQ